MTTIAPDEDLLLAEITRLSLERSCLWEKSSRTADDVDRIATITKTLDRLWSRRRTVQCIAAAARQTAREEAAVQSRATQRQTALAYFS